MNTALRNEICPKYLINYILIHHKKFVKIKLTDFIPPEPADHWEGIRDALKEGSVAAQIDKLLGNGFTGEEDCLFLNLPGGADDKPKPVMVWIHGGGFFLGSGNTDLYGPDYFMNVGDVILVTLNYRLGPLGFLSTGDAQVPGNMGFKDQVMALRWVQLNIAHFGGDPGNVTIFGESAGAGSVHHLMLSPMCKGLFHRVIAQSGCTLLPWAFIEPSKARKKAFKLGETLGCCTESSEELVHFLEQVPVKELLEAVEKALGADGVHPLPMMFTPTIEEDGGSQECFLSDTPTNLISEGKFNHVPLMIGYTTEEGIFVLKDPLQNPEWFESLNEKFHVLVANILHIDDEAKAKELAAKIKPFYFGDKRICKDTYQEYSDFISDVWFHYGIHRVVKEQTLTLEAPLYLYRFAYDGKLAFSNVFVGENRLPGASHGDELGYLFHMAYHSSLNLKPEDECMNVMATMLRLWTNFAKTGNPTPDNDELEVKWNPISKTNASYLNIDRDLSIQSEVNEKRLAFWEEIFESFMGTRITDRCESISVFIVSYGSSCAGSEMDDTVIVKVKQGFLRGRAEESIFGRFFYSFKGVPYAKPPLGQLRFKEKHPFPMIFAPTNEPFIADGEEAFLPDTPMKIMAEGRFNKVPMIWGVTVQEIICGEVPHVVHIPQRELRPHHQQQLHHRRFREGSRNCHQGQKLLLRRKEDLQGDLAGLFSDLWINVGMTTSIRKHLASSSTPIYLNPTPEKEDTLLGVQWTPTNKADMKYLRIDQDLSLQTDLLEERMLFWRKIYESI
ncbi:hypothetical protein C0J52_09112 [Blattella germanica]|nr:hypothetical protein C0J52_09112 [Blattella germanica]